VPLVPPDATAIAITGIVVSGVVGPAFAAGFAARHADRVHELEIIKLDRAEARALLDEAAQALIRGARLSGVIRHAYMTHGATIRARASETLERFTRLRARPTSS